MKEELTSRNLLYNNRFGLKVNYLLAFSSTIKTSHDCSVSFWILLAFRKLTTAQSLRAGIVAGRGNIPKYFNLICFDQLSAKAKSISQYHCDS